MKKILSVITIVAILLTLGSCNWFKSSKKSDDAVQTTSKRQVVITKEAVQKQVEAGKIDGAHFAIGAKIDEVKQYFLNIVQPETTTAQTKIKKKGGTTKVITKTQATNPNYVTEVGSNEEYYEYYKGASLTSVYYQGEKYFYANDKLDSGAAIIVCSNKAFGFNIGNCPSIDVIHSLGEPDVADIPDFDQLFFCLGTPINPTRLTYNFGTKRLDFIFSDDNLLVVTLTETSLYNGFTTCQPTTTGADAAVTSAPSTSASGTNPKDAPVSEVATTPAATTPAPTTVAATAAPAQ